MKHLLILLVTTVLATPAFASFTKLAECSGVTEDGDNATMIIFVSDDDDSTGFLSASIEDVWDYLSETAVNWNTKDGYPQVHENDFDLDVIISDQNKSTDDVIIDDVYVERLECEYTPKAS